MHLVCCGGGRRRGPVFLLAGRDLTLWLPRDVASALALVLGRSIGIGRNALVVSAEARDFRSPVAFPFNFNPNQHLASQNDTLPEDLRGTTGVCVHNPSPSTFKF